MAAMEEKNQEVRKQLEKTKKLAKKAQIGIARDREVEEVRSCSEIKFPEGKWWIDKDDLKPRKSYVSMQPPVSPPPDLHCISCQSPVYFYEYPEIPQCLWCNKELDTLFES